MNLLKDPFISTTDGKVSLKTILTTDHDYQLQYFFDETQLAMLQMLASLTTVVLNPTIVELKGYLSSGLTPEQYDQALEKIETKWFEDDCFMRSLSNNDGFNTTPICKLVSGIEAGGSKDASGLFSDKSKVALVCSDCCHVLNYNLHMNISGQYFSKYGSSGIRGGGVITTLISGSTLRETILFNTIAIDVYLANTALDEDREERFMWDLPPQGELYQASKISLNRGLFALAYHVKFETENESCICDICGSESENRARYFSYLKYKGQYGSVRSHDGKENGAGLWLHPYTPRRVSDNGTFSLTPYGLNWNSWQDLTSYVASKEINNKGIGRAYIATQFQNNLTQPFNLLIGGNITKKASIVGRVYDLYSMPSTLPKNLKKISRVVDTGLQQMELLSLSFKELINLTKKTSREKYAESIKEHAMQRFTANAQQIIQQILLDVERKEASQLMLEATLQLNQEAKVIFKSVQRKYQHDLPLFKALVKGEHVLYQAKS